MLKGVQSKLRTAAEAQAGQAAHTPPARHQEAGRDTPDNRRDSKAPPETGEDTGDHQRTETAQGHNPAGPGNGHRRPANPAHGKEAHRAQIPEQRRNPAQIPQARKEPHIQGHTPWKGLALRPPPQIRRRRNGTMSPRMEDYLRNVRGLSERRIEFYKMVEEEMELIDQQRQQKLKHRGA